MSKPNDADAEASNPTRSWWRKKRWWLGGLLGLLLIALIAARIAMVPALLFYVNRTLDRDPRFDGQVDDIDVNLWRGAYAVRGVRLDQTAGGASTPLLELDTLDLSVQWGALLAGEIVGEVKVVRPKVTFVDAEGTGNDQTGADGPWLKVLTDLFPFRLNRVTIEDASVFLRSERGDTPVEVHVSGIHGTLDDLANVRESTAPLVTTLNAEGKVMEQADFEVKLELDPTSYRPTFNLAFRMLDLDLTLINGIARTYGGVDFEGGRFDLVLEAEADAGLVEGSVKPLFRNLKVFTLDGDVAKDDPLNSAWQLVVGLTGELLENQARDQFGTVVDFSLDGGGLDLSVIDVVGNVLRNAFVQALLPKLRDDPTAGASFSAPRIAE